MAGNLLERAIGGAMELIGELAQVLDQPVTLVRELLDMRAHLLAIAICIITHAAGIGRRASSHLLRLRPGIAQDLFSLSLYPRAVTVGVLT